MDIPKFLNRLGIKELKSSKKSKNSKKKRDLAIYRRDTNAIEVQIKKDLLVLEKLYVKTLPRIISKTSTEETLVSFDFSLALFRKLIGDVWKPQSRENFLNNTYENGIIGAINSENIFFNESLKTTASLANVSKEVKANIDKVVLTPINPFTYDKALQKQTKQYAADSADRWIAGLEKATSNLKESTRLSLLKGIKDNKADILKNTLEAGKETIAKSGRAMVSEQTTDYGRYKAALNTVRNVNAGLSEYEWVTSGQDNVRPTHRDLNGNTFEYGGSTPIGFAPGEDFNCRCTDIPIFKDD